MTDKTGRRFGSLIVTSFAYKKYDRDVYWQCLCDCGNTTVVADRNLEQGRTKACGDRSIHAYNRYNPIQPGQVFGKLTVIKRGPNEAHRGRWWCECACGFAAVLVRTDYLVVSTDVRSCGCLTRNPDLTDEERQARRNIPGYDEWKRTVKKHDGYACQVCGYDEPWGLHVHHMNAYHSFHDQRVEIENGITLCEHHHRDYHSWSELPRGEVTREDFEKYLTTVLEYVII